MSLTQVRRMLFGLLFLNSMTCFCQKVELLGGINKNEFYDFRHNLGHFNSSYISKYGYTLRIGMEDLKVDWMTLKLSLGFDKVAGELTIKDGGLGGSSTTNAKVQKSLISLGVFPLNFKITNNLHLNFGFEISGLANEKVIGTSSQWHYGSATLTYDLNEKNDRFSSRTYFGLCGRIAYSFEISDKMKVIPQYFYYLGLSDEFVMFPESTRSMRHYFCIGVQRKLE